MAKLRHLAPEKMIKFYTKNSSIHLPDGWSGSTLPKDKGGPDV